MHPIDFTVIGIYVLAIVSAGWASGHLHAVEGEIRQ